MVTRDELKRELWPEDTFVDFDHSLNTAVKKLRKALGDSPYHPRFIETVPKRGYRFLAPVAPAGETAPEEGPEEGRRFRSLAAVALVAVVGIAGALAWIVTRSGPPEETLLIPVPLTTYPGGEWQPTLSPDGTQVAFTWARDRAEADIYVKVIGEEPPHRLTDHPALDVSPAWSPDGRLIAYLRHLGDGRAGVFQNTPLGHNERRLAEVNLNASGAWGPYLDWTPDSRYLAVVHKDSAEAPEAIFLLSIDTRELRRLTTPPQDSDGDGGPAFSPDGRTLAFSRDFAGGETGSDIFLPLSRR